MAGWANAWVLIGAIVFVAILQVLADGIFVSEPWRRWTSRALTVILAVLRVRLALASWPLRWRLLH